MPSGGPGSRPPTTEGSATVTDKPTPASGVHHNRTEFVILFIWKEPTPSDRLRGFDEPATTTRRSKSRPRKVKRSS